MTDLQELSALIVSLEKALFSQEVRLSPEKLDQLIADDFQEIGASGYRFGKKEVLERLPLEVPPKISASQFELKQLAPNCVQLLYRSKMSKHGDHAAHYSQRCSLWQKKGEQWQMVFHQGTPCGNFEKCS